MDELTALRQKCLSQLRLRNFPEVDGQSIDQRPGSSAEIGYGAFCSVYRVRAIVNKSTSTQIFPVLSLGEDIKEKFAAVKAPHTYRIRNLLMGVPTSKTLQDNRIKKVLKYYSRECDIWKTINAKRENARDNNLVELYGFIESYEDEGFPAFVSRYYELGDVRRYISKEGNPMLSEKQKLYLISDVAKALSFIHSVCGVAHRDVRGSNVLLEKRDTRLFGILGDFGSAKIFIHEDSGWVTSSSETGNERWSPPEYSTRGGFHDDRGPGDIWSLGCTMLEVLQEADPWYQVSEGDIPDKISRNEYPPKDEKISQQHYNVMKRCWTSKDKRPLASELYAEIDRLAASCSDSLVT